MNKLIQYLTIKELKKRRQKLLEEVGNYFVNNMDSGINALSKNIDAVDEAVLSMTDKMKAYGQSLFIITECVRLIEVDRITYNNSLNSFEPYIHKIQLRWSHGIDSSNNEEIKIHLFELDESLAEYKLFFDQLFPLTLTD